MNLSEQRRYALAFLRWYKRHERRAYRLVRRWLSGIQQRVFSVLNQIGIQGAINQVADLVQNASVQNVLASIYRYTMPEAAKRELERLIEKFPQITQTSTVAAQAGFFSQRWNNTVSRMLSDSQTAQRITQIAQTTRDQIRRVLVQANAENVDVRETARRLREMLGGKGAARRALMIARTETTRAASAGHEAGAMSTSLKLSKVWIATADSRTRDDHRAMIGTKPVPKDGYFLVGGLHMKYPGDPAGGATQCINCRCVQAYVPAVREDFMQSPADDQPDSDFTPADSVAEAETYAKRFFNEVSYKGFTSEQANRVNRQLDKIYRDLKLDQLGFKVDNFSLKGLKGNAGMSTYKMGKTGMHLDKSIFGTKELEQAYVANATKKTVLPKGVPRFSTATDPAIPSLEAVIVHEFGHQLDYEFTLMEFSKAIAGFEKGELSQLARQVSFYGISPAIETFCEVSALYFTGHQDLIPAKLRSAYEQHLGWVKGLIDKRIARLNKKRRLLSGNRKHGKRPLSFL